MMQPGALLTVIVGDRPDGDRGPVIVRARLTRLHSNGDIDVDVVPTPKAPWTRTGTMPATNEGRTWARGWGARIEAALRAAYNLGSR